MIRKLIHEKVLRKEGFVVEFISLNALKRNKL